MPVRADGPRQTTKSKHRQDWQQQIRQDCLQRVHQQRERLLHQCRTQSVHQTLESVLSNVTQQREDQSELVASTGNEASESSKAAGKPLLGHQLLSVEEHQELMAQMEAALFDEGYREELEAIEAAEIEDVSDLFSMHCIVYTPKVEEQKVLCPVCKKAHLVESAFGSISCPVDGFCIEAPMQGVGANLEYAKDMICTKLEEHKAGCSENPHFFVKHIATENLYMACYECGAFEVII